MHVIRATARRVLPPGAGAWTAACLGVPAPAEPDVGAGPIESCAPSDVADRLPGIFEDHDLVGQEGDALEEMAR